MKNRNLHNSGMLIVLLITMYYFITDGNPLMHYSSILWAIFIVGLGMINIGFQKLEDAKGGKDE